jgi:hypothetical protein
MALPQERVNRRARVTDSGILHRNLRGIVFGAWHSNISVLSTRAGESWRGFNQALAGRELRMIESKQELNALCAQFGQPPRYAFDGQEVPS